MIVSSFTTYAYGDATNVVLNVKDFGAQGDGKTDDTDAIQATVNVFVQQFKQQQTRVSYHDNPAGRTEPLVFCAQQEIIFPEGVYRITRPIVFDSRYAYMRGLGNVVIEQSNPQEMAFYFHSTKESRIKNLTFTGGSTHLRFWTGNKNGALVYVDACTFRGSSDYAVISRSYTQMKLKGDAWHRSKPWPPLTVKWDQDKPILIPNDPQDIAPFNNSTLAVLSNCKFDQCMRAADLTCDLSVVRDSSINVPAQADGPQFKFWKQGRMYRIQGQANPAAGKYPYWVENQALLSIRDIKLITHGKTGMELTRTNLPGYKEGWLGLIVENARLTVAGSQSNAVAWFGKDIAPNILSFVAVSEVSNQPVKAVAWDKHSDFSKLDQFPNATTWQGAKLVDQFHVTYDSLSQNIDQTLPAELQSYRHEPIPAAVKAQTQVRMFTWGHEDLCLVFKDEINAVDYGLDDDPKTDDTDVLRRIFEAAQQSAPCQVVFPGVVIRLSDTIQLPSNVIVRARGIVVFEQTAKEKVLFEAQDARQIGFENCLFSQGQIGVDLKSRNDINARISFKDCMFSGQMIGVRCLAGNGEVG
jgi:hypothetical protein